MVVGLYKKVSKECLEGIGIWEKEWKGSIKLEIVDTLGRDVDVLWIHNTTKIAIDDLKDWVEKGGKLLLTMKAVELIEHLKSEEKISKEKEKVSLDSMKRDIRGFQSYDNHPIFKDLHGGTYIVSLDALDDKTYSYVYLGQDAEVIGVDKRYISILPERKLVWGYRLKKGYILCIGAYIFWEEYRENPWKDYFSIFFRNVFEYLKNPVEAPVWPHGKFMFERGKFPCPDFEFHIPNTLSSCDLKISSTKNDEFILPGERAVVIGREKGRIEEVWIHPVKVLKEMKMRIDGARTEKLVKETIIRPEYVEILGDNLRYYVMTSLRDPAVYFHIDFLDDDVHLLDIDFSIPFRIMWPFDENYLHKVLIDTRENMVSVMDWKERYQAFYIFSEKPIKRKMITRDKKIYLHFRFSVKNSITLAVVGKMREDLAIDRILDLEYQNKALKRFFEDVLKRVDVKTDDKILEESLKWAKIGLSRFLVRTPCLGRGLVAGYGKSLPGWFEGRPGYAWYFGRDSEWVSLALLDLGDFQAVKDNLLLLMKYQGPDGKIYHELTTSGSVHYDASDSTPLFILTFARYVKYTGDVNFAKRYWNSLMKAIEYVSSTDKNDDGLVENERVGHGWIEGGKIGVSHTTSYTNAIWIKALEEIIEVGNFLGKDMRKQREILKRARKAFERFWDPEKRYYCVGLDGSGKKIPYETVLPSVGMMLNVIPENRREKMLEDFASNEFTTDWGVRLVKESSEVFDPRGYHEGSVWPLFTGWVSLAEYESWRSINGYVHMMSNALDYRNWTKGYISEVLHGKVYKPAGICPFQAWSQSMVVQPFVEGMLGYKPDVLKKRVNLNLRIPSNINRLRVSSLPFSTGSVSVIYEREGENVLVMILKKYDESITLKVSVGIPLLSEVKSVFVCGGDTEFSCYEKGDRKVVEIPEQILKDSLTLHLKLKNFSDVKPPMCVPKPFSKSRGTRIVRFIKEGEKLKVIYEGKIPPEVIGDGIYLVKQNQDNSK